MGRLGENFTVLSKYIDEDILHLTKELTFDNDLAGVNYGLYEKGKYYESGIFLFCIKEPDSEKWSRENLSEFATVFVRQGCTEGGFDLDEVLDLIFKGNRKYLLNTT